jgi:hypothetical protein
MTAEELYGEISERKIILHRGHIFFNTREASVAAEWERRGARIVPHYTLDELKAERREVLQGWEVHVLGLLDPDWQADEEGNDVDVSATRLRELCLTI